MTTLRRKIQWNQTKSSPGNLVDLDTEYQNLIASVVALRAEKKELLKENEKLLSKNKSLKTLNEQSGKISDDLVVKAAELAKMNHNCSEVEDRLKSLKKEENLLRSKVSKIRDKVNNSDKKLIRDLQSEVNELKDIISEYKLSEYKLIYDWAYGRHRGHGQGHMDYEGVQ